MRGAAGLVRALVAALARGGGGVPGVEPLSRGVAAVCRVAAAARSVAGVPGVELVARGVAAVWSVALLACGGAEWVAPPHEPLPERPASEIAAALLLVGDAGHALRETSPLLHRLRADVERWSRALTEGSVAVAFLGDNVYPEGVRETDHDRFPDDSARLAGQVWTVSGPAARAGGTRGIFVPGNHDWGNRKGADGLARLRNMETQLEGLGGGNGRVALVPPAGTPGPVLVEVGDAVRLIALDTHWWLQAGEDPRKAQAIETLESLLGGDGVNVLLAHHPIASGGAHGDGGHPPLTPEWFLHVTGANVQDLNAAPYRRLRDALLGVFLRAGPPDVLAAGHDHSLQALRGDEPGEPPWMLVSGAGSMVEPVDSVAGLVWTAHASGYMTILVGRDGSADLHVTGAAPDVVECAMGPGAEACVREGVAAFRTLYSTRLW